MPRTARHHQALGERQGIEFQNLQEAANPDDISVLDFWPPELWENKSDILKYQVSDNLLQQP